MLQPLVPATTFPIVGVLLISIMGSSMSVTKDGRDQEAEQQLPADLRSCFLARLIAQGGRISTSTSNPNLSPKDSAPGQAAMGDNLIPELQADVVDDSVACSPLCDTADLISTIDPSISEDQSDEDVVGLESTMAGTGENKKSKKKKRKKSKWNAISEDTPPSEQTLGQGAPAPKQRVESHDTSLQTEQSQPQLTPIAEEDEETPTKEAGESADDDTNVTHNPVDSGQPAGQAALPSTTDEVFRFDSFHPDTRCRNPECRTSTHPLDGSTKICPACGQRSKVRYCSKTCLYKDLRRHFFGECGRSSVGAVVDQTSLDDANKPVRPYLRHASSEMVNTVERHRQAVYFAMEEEGEYFIFDDVRRVWEQQPRHRSCPRCSRHRQMCLYRFCS